MISDKEFKSPLKFPGSGYEMVTCHYPLRLDVYSGCVHDCVYCYAGHMLRARGMWDPNLIKMADINRVEHEFKKAFEGKRQGLIVDALRHRLPVRIGGLTDCFQVAEKETGTTLKLLKLLNKYDYPFMIVTKGDTVYQPDYLKEIAKGKAYVQVTIISLDDKALKKIEPGAPPISKRFKAIKKLSDAGVFVCGRLSPVIPVLSTEHIDDYVSRMAQSGARHILAEFFRGTRKMIETIEEMAGIKFMDVMVKKKSYYRASIKYKNAFYEKLSGEFISMHRIESEPYRDEKLLWPPKNGDLFPYRVDISDAVYKGAAPIKDDLQHKISFMIGKVWGGTIQGASGVFNNQLTDKDFNLIKEKMKETGPSIQRKNKRVESGRARERISSERQKALFKFYENDIEERLLFLLDELGLELYTDTSTGKNGRQFVIEGGRIDLLCKDIQTDDFVIIELKKGEAPQETLLQILRYMSWVKLNLAIPWKKNVKGIILTEHADKDLKNYLDEVPNVDIKYYKVTISLI